jgi:hypothetical protein
MRTSSDQHTHDADSETCSSDNAEGRAPRHALERRQSGEVRREGAPQGWVPTQIQETDEDKVNTMCTQARIMQLQAHRLLPNSTPCHQGVTTTTKKSERELREGTYVSLVNTDNSAGMVPTKKLPERSSDLKPDGSQAQTRQGSSKT